MSNVILEDEKVMLEKVIISKNILDALIKPK